MVTLSASKFCLAPLPKPSLRLRRSSSISAVVTDTEAGIPSKIPTKAGPWDSPAVNHLIA
jgi:hypothetical protein